MAPRSLSVAKRKSTPRTPHAPQGLNEIFPGRGGRNVGFMAGGQGEKDPGVRVIPGARYDLAGWCE